MATQEQQIRARLFAGIEPFDTAKAGFVPLPALLRRAQFLFTPRTWQIYSWLLMKAGPQGVSWATLQEIGFDLDFRSVPKLKPYLDELVAAGWLAHANSRGRDFYMAADPLTVLQRLHADGKINDERWEHIEELVELLRPRRALREAS